jgi:hypothetical protein
VEEPKLPSPVVERAAPILQKFLKLKLLPSVTNDSKDAAEPIRDADRRDKLLPQLTKLKTDNCERNRVLCEASSPMDKLDPTLIKHRRLIVEPNVTKLNTDKEDPSRAKDLIDNEDPK